jgi:hypothetical protein
VPESAEAVTVNAHAINDTWTVYAPTVKPAAIRGRDIDIYIGPSFPPGTDAETARGTKRGGIQSADVDWRVTLQMDEEMGNYHYSEIDFDVPQVSGSLTFRAGTPAALLTLMRDLSGETTGVQFADSQAVLIGNFIHDNDHGVNVAGKSSVRLERNVITRSLFEAVVVNDRAKAVLISNTLVKNGGGAAFLGQSQSDVSGNVVGFNRVGFLVASSSRAATSYNAFYNTEGDYLRVGNPNQPAPELKAQSDITGDPFFVDPAKDDFRLRPDTPLIRVGSFPFLGALPPLISK